MNRSISTPLDSNELLKSIHSNLGNNIISNHFNFLNELTLEVSKENLISLLTFLKQTPEPGFEVLMDLTAVDYIYPKTQTKVVYWLHNPTTLNRVRVIVFAIREMHNSELPMIPSVTGLWEGANWYEREVFDFYGVKFTNHPNMTRLLMPDDWQGHPLRKDYPLTEESVEFKHGVKPKVPSEIIPNSKKLNAKNTRNIN